MCYRTSFLFLGCGHTVHSHQAIPNAPPCTAKSEFQTPGSESSVDAICSSYDKREQTWQSLQQHEPVSLTWHGRNRTLAMPQAAGLPTPCSSNTGTRQNKTPNSGCSISDQSMETLSSGSGAEMQQTSRRSSGSICDTKTSHPLHTFRVNALCKRCEIHRQRKIAIFEVKMIAESVERSLGRHSPTRTDGATSMRTSSTYGDSRMSMVSITGENRKRRRLIEGPLEGGEDGERKKRGIIPFRAGTDWYNSRSHAVEEEEKAQATTPRLEGLDAGAGVKPEVNPDTIQQQATPPPEASIDQPVVVRVTMAPNPADARDALGRNTTGMNRIMGWAGF